MHRGQKGNDPAVEYINEKPYLRASTGHGGYGTLEVRGTEQFFFLANSGFVIAVHETLPYWGSVRFPAAYRSMHEIMSAVSIKPLSQMMGTRAKTVELHLSAACIITMDYSKQIVSMPVEDFAVQAMNHFAESRLLDTSSFDGIFTEALKLRWEGGTSGLSVPLAHTAAV